jgi:hypothetical protein
VLSVIALYIAGRCASRLSGVSDRNLGIYHGLVTYGMSLFAAILVAALALGSTVPGNATLTTSHNAMIGAASTGGWWLFIACLLGMISALAGGSNGARPELRPPVAIDRERELRAA